MCTNWLFVQQMPMKKPGRFDNLGPSDIENRDLMIDVECTSRMRSTRCGKPSEPPTVAPEVSCSDGEDRWLHLQGLFLCSCVISSFHDNDV